jgi:hypothetical protein
MDFTRPIHQILNQCPDLLDGFSLSLAFHSGSIACNIQPWWAGLPYGFQNQLGGIRTIEDQKKYRRNWAFFLVIHNYCLILR